MGKTPDFALPHNDNIPAFFPQLTDIVIIPFGVSDNLFDPKFLVGFGQCSTFTGMSVPEASVNKYYGFVFV